MLSATLQFLNANDYDLVPLPVEEAYKTVVEVALGNLSLDDLTDWTPGQERYYERFSTRFYPIDPISPSGCGR